MKNVYEVLKELEADNSKLGKLAILESQKDNEFLKRFFWLSLNPYINFWQKKIPVYKQNKIQDGSLKLSMDIAENVLAKRKMTGNDAKELLAEMLENLTAEDADILQRIIKKDPKCGVSESTVNKVWGDLIPTYPCLLASPYSDKLAKKIFDLQGKKYIQLKSDGLRCNIIVSKDGVVQAFTRSGRELDVLGRFDALGSDANLRGQVIDGELLTINPKTGKFNNRQTSNGICSKAVKNTMSQEEADTLHLVAWDLIPEEKFKAKKDNTKYETRLENLVGYVSCAALHTADNLISVVESAEIKSIEEANVFYQKKLAEGEEGAMLKHGSMPWEDTRSKLQLKMKSEETCSLRVVSFKEGEGKLKGNLGSLDMTSEDNVVNVSISGFTLKVRSEIYANLTNSNVNYLVMNKEGEWETRVAKPGDSTINLNSILDVMYNQKIQERGGEWSLFLPRFDKERPERNTADTFSHIK